MGTCGDRCDGERQDKKEMRGKYFAEHRGAELERGRPKIFVGGKER